MVYSTCSLNPLENEAVVSAALAQNSDMSLLDVSERLPGLVRRPGMTSWKVFRRQVAESVEVKSYADLEENSEKAKYPTTLWPDGHESTRGLDRCLRIYPHLQNTGGFFVAVLEKAQSAPTKKEKRSVTVLNGYFYIIEELCWVGNGPGSPRLVPLMMKLTKKHVYINQSHQR